MKPHFMKGVIIVIVILASFSIEGVFRKILMTNFEALESLFFII